MNTDYAYDAWLDEPMERAEAQAARAQWEEEQELEEVTAWLARANAADIVRVWNVVAWDTQEAIDLADLMLWAAFDPHRIDSARSLATFRMAEFLAPNYRAWRDAVDKYTS